MILHFLLDKTVTSITAQAFEPNSVMLLHSNGHSTLFCRQKNPELEKWDGFMWGPEAAKDSFGFDEAYDINNIKMTFYLS